MDTVTVRELREQGSAVLDRVQAGERLLVSRAGIDSSTLLALWRDLPYVDPDEFRRDIDRIIDPSL